MNDNQKRLAIFIACLMLLLGLMIWFGLPNT